MKKSAIKTSEKSRNGTFREQAEKEIDSRLASRSTAYSEPELLRLNHELEVYQVELELINDELQRSESAAKELSEKYVELYDFAPTGYMTISQDGVILESNFAAASLLERSRSELTGKAFEHFVSLAYRSIFASFLKKSFERKRKKHCEIAVLVDKDNLVYVHLTGVVKANRDQCFVTFLDVTNRKMEQEALSEAKERAEQSERLKSSFLANLSHEIGTPMNGILGFANLLKTSKYSLGNQIEYVRMIELSGLRLLSILNDIVSMSQIETESLRIVINEVNINSLMIDLYDLFSPAAQLKNISLRISGSIESSSTIINTDQDKLYSIFSNLIKNAIKFTDCGSVEFGFKRYDDCWEFFVKDTGIGIRDADRELVFERFRQVDESLTRTHGGSGLGLSIAQAYVEMLGGKIWIGDSSSEGSVFYFTIPVCSAR